MRFALLGKYETNELCLSYLYCLTVSVSLFDTSDLTDRYRKSLSTLNVCCCRTGVVSSSMS